ncbi:hypothetical protein IWX49DRAFT_283994 [Phyllosticta citricarpa]|uniref:Secreted protein n=1 Tax=Phyllosticta citricarpa TaxID=55181 RepID=A0ABR1MK82_9PEZI
MAWHGITLHLRGALGLITSGLVSSSSSLSPFSHDSVARRCSGGTVAVLCNASAMQTYMHATTSQTRFQAQAV